MGAAYVGVGGVCRKVKNIYVGVGGVCRKVKQGFVGVAGVARKIFSGLDITITTRYEANKSAFTGSATIGSTQWILYGSGGTSSSTENEQICGYTYIDMTGDILADKDISISYKIGTKNGDGRYTLYLRAYNSSGTSVTYASRPNISETYYSSGSLTITAPSTTTKVSIYVIYNSLDVAPNKDQIIITSCTIGGEQAVGAV